MAVKTFLREPFSRRAVAQLGHHLDHFEVIHAFPYRGD